MSKVLNWIKIRYRGKRFYLLKVSFNKVKGFKVKTNGITFVVINKNMNPIERSKTLHKLVKEHHNIRLFCAAGKVSYK
ncbi:hypothetical protein D4Z93_03405 [Clostridium fermenticellae]|uniref:Uncharacterized protein n=1 Tax=Clostridium fermenticellae TaxID=2068654 RepID=A0A386H1P0_9CLOT|nr:hypothetical protein [Clostridium fermenticellae]AYD39602.1 hypothetical protein D4Z93_03315 [Clostridium fermenticellae]AYD39617.1 hypothetical protein D4Z93_03405 [Clostridium fermenticellae]